MWTISTETIEASGYSNKTIKTSALRSDDGALLVYQGANRDCAQLFDYRRGKLCLRLSGSQYDGMLNPSGKFTVYLSFQLESFRRRHPGRSEPTEAEISRLKTDLVEALPMWGLALGTVPITAVHFE